MTQRALKPAAACLFKEWYQNLDKQRNLHTIAREIILDACAIDVKTFYLWLDGGQEIPTGSQQIINQVAGERIFVVSTPEISPPLTLTDVSNSSAEN